MKFYNQKINIDATLWSEILNNQKIADEKVLAILKCLYNFDKYEASGGEVAKILGYAHHAPLNIIIPNFSKRILQEYTFINPPRRSNGKIRYWHIPFLGTEGTGKFTWILRQELVEALSDKYGLNRTEQNITKELMNIEQEYHEGNLKETFSIRYERDPNARKACLKHYGYSCQICGFDFEKVYGPVGKGIINVHHIVPISEIKKEYKIDPVKDLIPICPNCHALIHSRREMFTIEEIKSFLRNEDV
jgi:5-methylcytosine-specific restriction protein A